MDSKLTATSQDNKSEIEKLLEEALENARQHYNIDEIMGLLFSAEHLLREDAGEAQDPKGDA